jgi:hypothetical protein
MPGFKFKYRIFHLHRENMEEVAPGRPYNLHFHIISEEVGSPTIPFPAATPIQV